MDRWTAREKERKITLRFFRWFTSILRICLSNATRTTDTSDKDQDIPADPANVRWMHSTHMCRQEEEGRRDIAYGRRCLRARWNVNMVGDGSCRVLWEKRGKVHTICDLVQALV